MPLAETLLASPASPKGARPNGLAGKPAQQGDRFCATERQYSGSRRLKLAHRSAGYLRLSFEINQTKPAISLKLTWTSSN